MSEKLSQKDRVKWIDMARGFAMLLIIVGHCAGISETVKHIIFSFHVPLFFILSGYVYRHKEKSILKDFKQLIVPYIISIFIIIIINIYANRSISWDYIIQTLKSAIYAYGSDYGEIKLIGGLWFLPTIFVARRFMNLAFSIDMKEHYRAVVFLFFTFLGVQISRYVWVPLNIDVALIASGFMYVGYLLKIFRININLDILLGCFLIWIGAVKTGVLEMSTRVYDPWPVIFCGSVAASICVIYLCEKLERFKILQWTLSFVGMHTILLLCIHDLDWRLPFGLWWGFLQNFEGQKVYFLLSVVCRMGFDLAVMCGVLVAVKVLKKIGGRFWKRYERT